MLYCFKLSNIRVEEVANMNTIAELPKKLEDWTFDTVISLIQNMLMSLPYSISKKY